MKYSSIAVIGVGVHASAHISFFAEIGIEKVYYFDPKNELKPTGFEVIRAATLDDLFAMTPGLPVYIGSPDEFHLSQIQRAILEKRDVMGEKPLLNEPTDREALIDVFAMAEANECKLTSCHPRRFDPPFAALLRSICANESDYTSGLGNLKKLEVHCAYKAPKEGRSIPSLMKDKLNHDLDLLQLLFKVENIKLDKEYDSPRAFRVGGSVQTEDGKNINFSFGGHRYAEGGYQEWIMVTFENGFILINPVVKNPRNALNDAEIVVINTSAKNADHHVGKGLGTNYQKRDDDVTAAVLAEFSGEKAYVTPIELLFNNLLSMDVVTPWGGNDESNGILDGQLTQLHRDKNVDWHLEQAFDAAKESDFETCADQLFLAQDTQDVRDSFILKHLGNLTAGVSFSRSKREILSDLNDRIQQHKQAKDLTESYLKVMTKCAGVLPYYEDEFGLHFGVIIENLLDKNIYNLAGGGYDVHVMAPNGKEYTMDLRKPHKLPKKLALDSIILPVTEGRNAITTVGSYNKEEKEKSKTFLTDKHTEREILDQRLECFYKQLFFTLIKNGWKINSVESDLVAAIAETHEEHGFQLDQTIETKKIDADFPSARDAGIVNIEHVFYLAKISPEMAKSVKLTTAKQKGCWMSLPELEQSFQEWVKAAVDFKDGFDKLIVLAYLQKYVGIILSVSGETEIKDRWMSQLTDLKESLAKDFYANYDHDEFMRQLENIEIQAIKPEEWDGVALAGFRPSEEISEKVLKDLQAPLHVLSGAQLGLFACKPGDAMTSAQGSYQPPM